MDSETKQQSTQFKIMIFRKQHAKQIAGFQIKMAKQTQNLDLIPDLVNRAVQYVSDHHQLGFYLVKLNEKNIPIGSLLLTFQNTKSWWIQSVYIEKQYRREGHFKSLFKKACQVAKQNGSQSLKLYAETANQKAKQTYNNLGMQTTGQKFYTYDFVYGKTKIQQFQNLASQNNLIIQNSQSDLSKQQNQFNQLLLMKQSKNKSINIFIKKQNQQKQLIGRASYFTQFSQWRFGIIYYVDSLLIKKQEHGKDKNNQLINKIHSSLCSYFKQISEINVGALRYIFNEENDFKIENILSKGEVEHYDVMEIKI